MKVNHEEEGNEKQLVACKRTHSHTHIGVCVYLNDVCVIYSFCVDVNININK